MTSPITDISIAGVSLDLGDVDYSVQVQHGRNDITSVPEASSCQIVVYGASGVAAEMADSLTIEAYGFRRFTGEITDLNIRHLSSDPPTAVTTITGMGNLAKLGFALTGIGGNPHETVRQRAETILTDGGQQYLNAGSPTLEVHQQNGDDIQVQTVLDALAQLAQWSGATYFDTPEGLIAFEAYEDRGLTAFAGTWDSQVATWAELIQAWDSFATSTAAYPFPAGGVVWTPEWTQNLNALINDITVTYGLDENDYEQDDETGSVALYGRRANKLVTQLRNDSDAIDRAGKILAAQAYPLWSLGQISVRVDLLTQPDRDKVLALVNGSTVQLNDLPAPAPYTQFTGIVEGWAETYNPGTHVMTFSISDPRYSYQTVAWEDVDAALTWGNVNPILEWYNAVSSDDLAA